LYKSIILTFRALRCDQKVLKNDEKSRKIFLKINYENLLNACIKIG